MKIRTCFICAKPIYFTDALAYWTLKNGKRAPVHTACQHKIKLMIKALRIKGPIKNEPRHNQPFA